MFRKSSIGFKIFEIIMGTILLTSFFLITIPTTIVTISSSQLYRCTLILYVKLFRKDIVGIMGGNNPIMAIDNIHTRPLSTAVFYGAFHSATTEHMMQIARNFALHTNPVDKQLMYPETRQYYEEWLGYLWWKREENFIVDNHITIWDEETITSEKDFIKIIANLEAKPFPKGRSPWEVILLRNVFLENVKHPEIPNAAIIFRIHHGFVDGMSLLQLFRTCVFDQSADSMSQPKYGSVSENRSTFEKLLKLGTIFQFPYLFLKQMVCAMDFNPWHLSEAKLSRQIHRAWSKPIPVPLIKEIKFRHGVGFTAVLVATCAGALRKLMTKYNVKVPKGMNALVPLPSANHPTKLCNHWSFCFLELPTGEINFCRRLERVHKYIEALKRSILPAGNFYVLTLLNMLPTWILKRVVVTNYLPTVFLSTLPGPPPGTTGLGCPLSDSMFTLGPMCGNIGIQITILSSNDAIRVVVGVDSSIFHTQEMTDQFIQIIEEEFYDTQQQQKSTPLMIEV